MDPNAPDSEQQQQQQLYYPPHIIFNQSRIYSTKFLTSCFAGAAAGILGLENFRGFAVFFFATLLSSALLWLRCKGSPKKYVPGGLVELVNPGQENLFSFLLVWTLFYGIVHGEITLHPSLRRPKLMTMSSICQTCVILSLPYVTEYVGKRGAVDALARELQA